MGKWEFWIDRGGTFTDIVAKHPDGTLLTHKLLSENPEAYPDAALQGIRDLTGTAPDELIPSADIRSVKMGTTVATNALLERSGDRVLLLTNTGFADALEIGYQSRPRLFDREIVKPALLYERVAEVDGRVLSDGKIDQELDEAAAVEALENAFNCGIRAVAIVFMHAYRYPSHEKRAADLARKIGFTQISASHQVSPLIRFVGRGDTTVVDAYLSPILRRYVNQVAAQLDTENSDLRLMFMMSSGGLTAADLFQGRDAILSGPAGGIVGAVQTSKLAGYEKIIGFDMGGTSTDVSHYAGEFEKAFETEVAGVRMRAPMMKIHTVAAGGGSILNFDGSRFRVGPESAGANPGPACYRRGGPLTVTDANVMLGRVQPAYFPKIFGKDQNLPVDTEVVTSRFSEIAKESAVNSAELVAEGFLRIAVENMANAVKKISVQRGYDITKYALACFGGAGGQHACAVASVLGIRTILVHPFAGILSAYGMGLADIKAARQKSVEAVLNEKTYNVIRRDFYLFSGEASKELQAQGVSESDISFHRILHLKYKGSDSAIEVPFASIETMQRQFTQMHQEQFGFTMPMSELVVDLLELEALGGGSDLTETIEDIASIEPVPVASTPIFFNKKWHEAPIYQRSDLLPGQSISGPSVIVEKIGTIIVDPGWKATLNTHQHLILEFVDSAVSENQVDTSADPVMLVSIECCLPTGIYNNGSDLFNNN